MEQSNFKIEFLIDYYDGPYAGTQVQLLKLIENLLKKNIDVTMAVFRHTNYSQSGKFPCPIEELKISKMASIRTIFTLIKYSNRLRKNDRRIVHIFFNDASIIAPVFLKLFGLKVIVSRRDMGFWYSRIILAVLRINSFLIDSLVVNSSAVKELVHCKEKVTRKKIRTIYNGYDISPCDESAEAVDGKLKEELRNKKIVGIVANLRPLKRIDDLIKAFSLISEKHQSAFLVIIGEDLEKSHGRGLMETMVNLTKSLGIESRTYFLGKVEKALPIIEYFTVGVLCSESEGFSNAIIEYMVCGKPVICTNVGGNTEIVKNDENGYLYNLGDIEALAHLLDRVLSDDSLCNKLGNNGRNLVKKKFSIDSMVSEHMNLYRSLL